MSERLSEAFYEVAELAYRAGAAPLNKHSGCWEYDVDGQWWIAVNGHSEPVACSRGPEVLPFNVYVEWRGWPAGSLSPYDGVFAAGEAANEDALIEALRAAAPLEER